MLKDLQYRLWRTSCRLLGLLCLPMQRGGWAREFVSCQAALSPWITHRRLCNFALSLAKIWHNSHPSWSSSWRWGFPWISYLLRFFPFSVLLSKSLNGFSQEHFLNKSLSLLVWVSESGDPDLRHVYSALCKVVRKKCKMHQMRPTPDCILSSKGFASCSGLQQCPLFH